MSLRLIGEVALDGSGFEAGLKKIEHGAERVGETLKGLALTAFGIYGIEQAIHKTVETAEKLVDTSRRLGVGLEALQEFGFAAKQNGADIDALTGFIEKLNSTRIDPKKFESYAKLGISQADLSSLKVEDLILKLSANVRGRSSQEIVGPLRDVGGKGAGAMIAMLKDDLAELGEEAHRLGIIMKDSDLVGLKLIGDEMTILAMIMVGQLAPALTAVMNTIIRIINGLRANLSIYPEFFKGKGGDGVKALFKELFSPHLFNQMPKEEFKQHLKDISQGWADAGAHANTSLTELNESSDAMIQHLLDVQKMIEEFNSHPDFENVMGEEKEPRGARRQIYSDSLLAVGGFLGSASNPMVSIGHTHTKLLSRIAEHTSRIGNKESSGHPPH